MIRFIPVTETSLNLGMAERWNEEYSNRICPDHPEGDSIIEMRADSTGTHFKVRSACCDKFYRELKKFETGERVFDD